jgi:hypothetical protein
VELRIGKQDSLVLSQIVFEFVNLGGDLALLDAKGVEPINEFLG